MTMRAIDGIYVLVGLLPCEDDIRVAQQPARRRSAPGRLSS
jgi:hypothetical protein